MNIELQTYLDKLLQDVVSYSAEFVPQSRSRKKGEKNPTLNWRVTIVQRTGVQRSLSVDYSQGIGHVPGYAPRSPRMSDAILAKQRQQEHAAETGRYPRALATYAPPVPLPVPAFADVLHCLILDTDVLDAGGFEQWATDYGYDPDSRAAESIYRQCIETSLQLRALLGDTRIAELRVLFQDY